MCCHSITTICLCSFCAIAVASASVAHHKMHKNIRKNLEINSFVNLYEPTTNVDASALIDKDVRTIFSRSNLGTLEGVEEAMKIYSLGAYSASYALLQIDTTSLSANISRGTLVRGPSTTPNEPAIGFLMEVAQPGDIILKVQYMTNCHVGGLRNPILNHCFMESTHGERVIQIGDNGQDIAYTYLPLAATKNGQTLELMGKGNPSLPSYSNYFEYSGAYDYANQMMLAAFEGSKTSFSSSKIDFDFSQLDLEGRTAAIQWGVVGMNIWSNVVEKMHQATIACTNENATHYWDEAVAFYTGSVTTFPDPEGYLLFTLAEIECRFFGTCSEGKMSNVNEKVFAAFLFGKQLLKNKQCQDIKELSSQIESLMKIPLIQRLLRHAQAFDHHGKQLNKRQGEAAAFAASLLPHLHVCQESSAHVLWRHLAPGMAPQASFEIIKYNLERVYDCLGVSCADVGGLVRIDSDSTSDHNNDYYAGAEPCGFIPPMKSNSQNETSDIATFQNEGGEGPSTILIVCLVGLSVIIASGFVALVKRMKDKQPEKVVEVEGAGNVLTDDDLTIVAAETGEIA